MKCLPFVNSPILALSMSLVQPATRLLMLEESPFMLLILLAVSMMVLSSSVLIVIVVVAIIVGCRLGRFLGVEKVISSKREEIELKIEEENCM